MQDEGLARQQAEAHVEQLLETLRQASILVQDFKSEHQEMVNAKVNDVVKHFVALDALKDNVEGELSLEVFKYLEQGKNPDLHTREVLLGLRKRNEAALGRVRQLKRFRDELVQQLALDHPEDAQAYEALVGLLVPGGDAAITVAGSEDGVH